MSASADNGELTSLGQMPIFKASIIQRLHAKGLFEQVGDYATAQLRDDMLDGLAVDSLKTKGKLSVTAVAALTPAQIARERMARDMAAVVIIQEKCTVEQKQFLLTWESAKEQYDGIQTFFGLPTLENQQLIKNLFDNITYKGDMKKFCAAKHEAWSSYTGAGGVMSVEQFLMDVITGARIKKDPTIFGYQRESLTAKLSDPQSNLDWPTVRGTLLGAEQRHKVDQDVSSDEDEPATNLAGTVQVTLLQQLQSEVVRLQAMVTAVQESGGRGGGRGGRGRGRGGRRGQGGQGGERDNVCFNWRDTGSCRFGDDCRFSH